jgi:hypothetical protein
LLLLLPSIVKVQIGSIEPAAALIAASVVVQRVRHERLVRWEAGIHPQL